MLINSRGKRNKKKKWEKLPYIIIQRFRIFYFFSFLMFLEKILHQGCINFIKNTCFDLCGFNVY